MDWQNVVALLIVAISACLWIRLVFLGRQTGCGSCGKGCSVPAKTGEENLVQLEIKSGSRS